MLAIRLHRAGRRNSSFFRIVLTEKSKPAKSGFKKVLGWYNPHTKESSFKKEEILSHVQNGAQVSNSLAKILTENKITHKNIRFVPDAPGKTKKKLDQSDEPMKTKPEKSDQSEPDEVTEETTADAKTKQEEKQDEQES
jgi:ribosomal protein S16